MCLTVYTKMTHNLPVPLGAEVDQTGGTSNLISETALSQESLMLDMILSDNNADPNCTTTTISALIKESANNASDSDFSVSNRDAASKNREGLVEPKISEFTHETSERRKFGSVGQKKNRRFVTHSYHDHSYATVPTFINTSDVNKTKHLIRSGLFHDQKRLRRGARGGVTTQFPIKLHQMLERVVEDGCADIVSWQPHGRCFILHKPKEFVKKLMSANFRQTKLTSFQRQLNLYGFRRLTTGRDKGGYYHELFLRGKPSLCHHMMRIRIKGTGIKAASSPETEPDFYSMPLVDRDDPACVSPQSTYASTYLNLRSSMQPSFASNTVSESDTSHSSQECKPQTAEQWPLCHVNRNISALSTVDRNSPISYESSSLFATSMTSSFVGANECVSLPAPSSVVPTDCDVVLSDDVVLDVDAFLFEGKPFHYIDTPTVKLKHLDDAPARYYSLPEEETTLLSGNSPAAYSISNEEQSKSSVDRKNEESDTESVHSTTSALAILEPFADPLAEPEFLDSIGVSLDFDAEIPDKVGIDSFQYDCFDRDV